MDFKSKNFTDNITSFIERVIEDADSQGLDRDDYFAHHVAILDYMSAVGTLSKYEVKKDEKLKKNMEK